MVDKKENHDAKGRAVEELVEITEELIEVVEELIDLEEHARAGRKPPRARRYRIRIDKKYFVVEQTHMTGRQLLTLAGKLPPEQFMISEKLAGGQARRIGLDEAVDFTKPGIERFMTLPLDQTEG